MVRLHPRRTRRALDHVQPVHVCVRIAPRGEIAGVPRRAGEPGVKKISVERNDDVRLRQVVTRLDGLSEGLLRAFHYIVAINGLVHVPLRHRIRLNVIANLPSQRRRGNGLREYANPAARHAFLGVHGTAQGFRQSIPGADIAEIGDVLRAVRIVEIENRCLRVNVRAAKARRMLRIAFNFGRPEHVALDQDGRSVSA